MERYRILFSTWGMVFGAVFYLAAVLLDPAEMLASATFPILLWFGFMALTTIVVSLAAFEAGKGRKVAFELGMFFTVYGMTGIGICWLITQI